MYGLQSNRTVPHPFEPAYLRGRCRCRYRSTLPSLPRKPGLETHPAALRMCGEELAAEGWSRSTEKLRRCGHFVEPGVMAKDGVGGTGYSC